MRRLRKNCLIRTVQSHCISFFHVSLQQARITTSDHVNDKELPEKQLIWLILILLTDCYFLTRTNSMLFPHLSFLSAQQRSVFCLINEYDDDDDDKVFNACPKAAWEPVTLKSCSMHEYGSLTEYVRINLIVFGYNSGVSWAFLTLFVSVEAGLNTLLTLWLGDTVRNCIPSHVTELRPRQRYLPSETTCGPIVFDRTGCSQHSQKVVQCSPFPIVVGKCFYQYSSFSFPQDLTAVGLLSKF